MSSQVRILFSPRHNSKFEIQHSKIDPESEILNLELKIAGVAQLVER